MASSSFIYFISLVGIFIGSYVYLYRKGDYAAVAYDMMKCYTMVTFYFKKIAGFLGIFGCFSISGDDHNTRCNTLGVQKETDTTVIDVKYDPILDRSTKYINKLDRSHFFILFNSVKGGGEEKSPAVKYFEEIYPEISEKGEFHFFLFHHPRFPGQGLFIVSYMASEDNKAPEYVNLVFNDFIEISEFFFKQRSELSTKVVPRIYPFVSSFGSFARESGSNDKSGSEDDSLHFTIPKSFLYRVVSLDQEQEDDFKDLLNHLKIGFFFQLEHHHDDQILHKNPSFSIIDENYEYHTF